MNRLYITTSRIHGRRASESPKILYLWWSLMILTRYLLECKIPLKGSLRLCVIHHISSTDDLLFTPLSSTMHTIEYVRFINVFILISFFTFRSSHKLITIHWHQCLNFEQHMHTDTWFSKCPTLMHRSHLHTPSNILPVTRRTRARLLMMMLMMMLMLGWMHFRHTYCTHTPFFGVPVHSLPRNRLYTQLGRTNWYLCHPERYDRHTDVLCVEESQLQNRTDCRYVVCV